MRKTLIMLTCALFLIAFLGTTLLLAEDEDSEGQQANAELYTTVSVDNNKTEYEEEPVLGASCGTVTPGYQDECCERKGYEGWDSGNFTCIGEQERERNKEKLKERARERLTDEQIHKLIQTRNKLMIASQTQNMNQSECPTNCSCGNSSMKCKVQDGSRMIISAGKSGNTIVQIKNAEMSTKVILYKSDEGKVIAVFKNNETREIILPDEVQDKIHEKLQEKDQDRNRTRINWTDENITLDEEGYYHHEARKKARLFWIVPVKERVHTRMDAETGEIIKVRKTWWGFLARDVRERVNESE